MTTAAAVPMKNNGHAAPPPPALTPPKFAASQLLALALIEPDPHNPRKDFPKEAMNELISSVMLHGVRSPIEVRALTPDGASAKAGVVGLRYRIVFGERRYRAAKAAGLKEIPAVVRQLTDIEAAEIQLDENLRRADLSPLEVAGGYQRQLELGRSIDQVCERAGKKRTQVYATLQLLQLGEAGRRALGEEKLSASVAQLVARVPKALQEKALSMVLGTEYSAPLTYRQAEARLAEVFTVELKRAPFDTKDAKLCPAAGACDDCPKRSGNAKDLYPDIKSPDVCTDRPCYDAKVLADARRGLEAKGWKMLEPQLPADELFWNAGRGPLKPETGYVDPEESCLDDAQSRAYGALLKPEQLKALVRVALDADGKPRQLLERSGLMRHVKKGGVFKERKAVQPKKEKPAEKPVDSWPPPPSVDELVDAAVVGACVEAVERKGPTPAMLRLLARELIGAVGTDYELYRRRGLKDPGHGRPDEKLFAKTFGALSTSKLLGLCFEIAIGARYMNGDGFGTIAEDLGVDVNGLTAKVEAAAAPPKPSLKELVAGKGAKVVKAVAAHSAKKAKAVKKGGKKK